MVDLKNVFKAYSCAEYRAWIDEALGRVCIFPKLKPTLWGEFWMFACDKGWRAEELTHHHKRYGREQKTIDLLYPKYFWKPIEWLEGAAK